MVEMFINNTQIEEYLRELGKVLCQILAIFPSNEFSITIKVSDDCFLEFTIAKKS